MSGIAQRPRTPPLPAPTSAAGRRHKPPTPPLEAAVLLGLSSLVPPPPPMPFTNLAHSSPQLSRPAAVRPAPQQTQPPTARAAPPASNTTSSVAASATRALGMASTLLRQSEPPRSPAQRRSHSRSGATPAPAPAPAPVPVGRVARQRVASSASSTGSASPRAHSATTRGAAPAATPAPFTPPSPPLAASTPAKQSRARPVQSVAAASGVPNTVLTRAVHAKPEQQQQREREGSASPRSRARSASSPRGRSPPRGGAVQPGLAEARAVSLPPPGVNLLSALQQDAVKLAARAQPLALPSAFASDLPTLAHTLAAPHAPSPDESAMPATLQQLVQRFAHALHASPRASTEDMTWTRMRRVLSEEGLLLVPTHVRTAWLHATEMRVQEARATVDALTAAIARAEAEAADESASANSVADNEPPPDMDFATALARFDAAVAQRDAVRRVLTAMPWFSEPAAEATPEHMATALLHLAPAAGAAHTAFVHQWSAGVGVNLEQRRNLFLSEAAAPTHASSKSFVQRAGAAAAAAAALQSLQQRPASPPRTRGAANGGGASAGAAGVLPASPPDVELTSPSAISQFGDAEVPRAHSSGGASPRGAQATAASVALLNSLSSLSSSLRTQVAAQRDALASDETTIASLSNAIHAMRSTMGAPLLTLSEVMLDGALRGALDVERVAACVDEQPLPASAPAASAEDVDSARAQLVKIARSMGVRAAAAQAEARIDALRRECDERLRVLNQEADTLLAALEKSSDAAAASEVAAANARHQKEVDAARTGVAQTEARIQSTVELLDTKHAVRCAFVLAERVARDWLEDAELATDLTSTLGTPSSKGSVPTAVAERHAHAPTQPHAQGVPQPATSARVLASARHGYRILLSAAMLHAPYCARMHGALRAVYHYLQQAHAAQCLTTGAPLPVAARRAVPMSDSLAASWLHALRATYTQRAQDVTLATSVRPGDGRSASLAGDGATFARLPIASQRLALTLLSRLPAQMVTWRLSGNPKFDDALWMHTPDALRLPAASAVSVLRHLASWMAEGRVSHGAAWRLPPNLDARIAAHMGATPPPLPAHAAEQVMSACPAFSLLACFAADGAAVSRLVRLATALRGDASLPLALVVAAAEQADVAHTQANAGGGSGGGGGGAGEQRMRIPRASRSSLIAVSALLASRRSSGDDGMGGAETVRSVPVAAVVTAAGGATTPKLPPHRRHASSPAVSSPLLPPPPPPPRAHKADAPSVSPVDTPNSTPTSTPRGVAVGSGSVPPPSHDTPAVVAPVAIDASQPAVVTSSMPSTNSASMVPARVAVLASVDAAASSGGRWTMAKAAMMAGLSLPVAASESPLLAAHTRNAPGFTPTPAVFFTQPAPSSQGADALKHAAPAEIDVSAPPRAVPTTELTRAPLTASALVSTPLSSPAPAPAQAAGAGRAGASMPASARADSAAATTPLDAPLPPARSNSNVTTTSEDAQGNKYRNAWTSLFGASALPPPARGHAPQPPQRMATAANTMEAATCEVVDTEARSAAEKPAPNARGAQPDVPPVPEPQPQHAHAQVLVEGRASAHSMLLAAANARFSELATGITDSDDEMEYRSLIRAPPRAPVPADPAAEPPSPHDEALLVSSMRIADGPSAHAAVPHMVEATSEAVPPAPTTTLRTQMYAEHGSEPHAVDDAELSAVAGGHADDAAATEAPNALPPAPAPGLNTNFNLTSLLSTLAQLEDVAYGRTSPKHAAEALHMLTQFEALKQEGAAAQLTATQAVDAAAPEPVAASPVPASAPMTRSRFPPIFAVLEPAGADEAVEQKETRGAAATPFAQSGSRDVAAAGALFSSTASSVVEAAAGEGKEEEEEEEEEMVHSDVVGSFTARRSSASRELSLKALVEAPVEDAVAPVDSTPSPDDAFSPLSPSTQSILVKVGSARYMQRINSARDARVRFSDKVHVTLVPPKSEPNSENDAHAHRDEDEGRLFDHASSMHGEGEDEGEGEGGVQLGMPRVLEAHDEEREYDDDDDDEEDEEAHIVNEHTVFDDSPGMRGQSSDARTSPVFDRRLVRNTAAVSHLRVWTGEEGGTEGAKHHADGVGVIADASGSAAKPKSWALWASVLK